MDSSAKVDGKNDSKTRNPTQPKSKREPALEKWVNFDSVCGTCILTLLKIQTRKNKSRQG